MRQSSRERPRVGGYLLMAILILGMALLVYGEEGAVEFAGPELEEVLQEYVQRGYAPSVAAVVIEEGEPYRAVAGDPMPGEDSLFQIGSITKSFTGLLLADAVAVGEVALETTVGDVFGASLSLDPEVATIQLVELATHSSGLPLLDRRAQIGALKNPLNPYRNMEREDLRKALGEMAAEDLGDRGAFAYSNLGISILGLALEEVLEEEYRELLRERILAPLEMEYSGFSTPKGQNSIGGYRANGRPNVDWELGAYDPAGGLFSTLEDMEGFLRAQLEGRWEAVMMSQEVLFQDSGREFSAGLGVVVQEVEGRRMVWHNGQTGGYFAWFGVLPEEGRGVVLLSNGAVNSNVARDLLLGERNLPGPPVNRLFWWFTVLGLLYLPLPAAFQGWKYGRWRKAPGEEKEVIRGGLASRIHVVSEGLGIALLAMVLWKFGSWQGLWIGWWWISVAAAIAKAAWLGWEARRMPWVVERGWRKVSLVLTLSFGVLGLIVVGWIWG